MEYKISYDGDDELCAKEKMREKYFLPWAFYWHSEGFPEKRCGSKKQKSSP